MAFPVFLYNIVLEKEKRLLDMMKINGVKMTNYWIINYVFCYLFYLITFLTLYLCGKYVFEFPYFVQSHPGVIFVIFNGWGMAQISWAFFTSVFLSKARTASIVGYGIAVYFMAISLVLCTVLHVLPSRLPWYYHVIPTFTFTRAVQHSTIECLLYHCFSTWDSVTATEARVSIALLYVHAVVYGALAWYFNQIVPQTYGVPKKWNFICQKKGRKVGGQGVGISYDLDEIGDLEEDRENNYTPVYDYDINLEDADTKAERNIVYNLDKADYYKYPLIVKDLRKEYPGYGGRKKKVATKNFSMRIKKGEMFGLLGPNGAGKTTIISMLTGLIPPTRGNAWVAGFDIRHQLEAVQLQIGLCPQFDLLWDNLTVREHLLFYARVKGIPPEKENEMVEMALKDVLLGKFANFMVSELSGGMKRRLSVAISLVADPKIIYLDEPSTGLDPENRRQLWDILVNLKGKRAMVLTTHSMEEADVLCNRIAIVNNGILRCIAPQVRLKSLYGGGYHLQINCQRQHYLNQVRIMNKQQRKMKFQRKNSMQSGLQVDYSTDESGSSQSSGSLVTDFEQIQERVKEFVMTHIPHADLIRQFNGNFLYLVPNKSGSNFRPSEIYYQFEANKDRLMISDWGLSQSSLEDVFTKICE